LRSPPSSSWATDEGDPDTRPRARAPFRKISYEEPPIPPLLAFVKTPHWDRVSAEAKEAFGELVESLGERVEEVDLVSNAAEAWDWHKTIMEADMAANLEREWQGRDKLSPQLRSLMERGRETKAVDYQRALRGIPGIVNSFDEMFMERYDAILTPSAAGSAPKGLTSTADPAFCTLWTLCGMPAISLPLMHDSGGLPIGVQLVGRRNFDARLLRTARWLAAASRPTSREAAARDLSDSTSERSRSSSVRSENATTQWVSFPLVSRRAASAASTGLVSPPFAPRGYFPPAWATRRAGGAEAPHRLPRAPRRGSGQALRLPIAKKRLERRIDVTDGTGLRIRIEHRHGDRASSPARRATGRCPREAGTARARCRACRFL